MWQINPASGNYEYYHPDTDSYTTEDDSGQTWDQFSSSVTGGSGSTNATPVGSGVLANEQSPTGYVDSKGNFVNADGTPYATPTGNGVVANEQSPTGYVDANGNFVNQDGTPYVKPSTSSNTSVTGTPSGSASTTATGSGTPAGGNKNAPDNGVTALLTKLGIDPKSLTSGNVAAIAGLGTILNQLTGGNAVQTNSYQGSIPTLSAVRSQIDPINQGIANGYGQQYFTNMNYVSPNDAAAAKGEADIQAKNIADAQQQRANGIQGQLPTSHPSIATNWQNSAGVPVQASTAATTPGANLMMTPANIAAIQDQVQRLQTNPGLYGAAAPNDVNAIDNQQQGGEGGGGNAHGGIIGAATGGVMPTGIAAMAHGRYLAGPTDGMADKLNTSIDGVQPAKLSHGEFVIPADVVSHLGNGNSDAGAKKLYQMMDKVRLARTGNKHQGKEINPDHFMPGGIAGYAKGGGIKGFDGTTGSAVTATPGQGTTSNNQLNPTFGPTVSNMVGQASAIANTPAPVYTGQLVAGPTEDQTQYFENASQIAQTGITPTQFTTEQWNNDTANKYMNPYVQSALDPQLADLQRSAAINEQGDLSKLTQAGAFGGSRQAVLQGQDQYNLLANQSNLIGQGYNTAYNNAMNSFNTANNTNLQAQQDQSAANQASANYAMNANTALGNAGATQEQIQQNMDTAALNQFNQQAQFPAGSEQFLQSMLTGLPVSSTSTTNNTSGASNTAALMNQFLSYYNTIMNPGGSSGAQSGSGTSSGTTSSASAGTTPK